MESVDKAIAEQRRLLVVEREAEREAFAKVADRLGVERLVRRGAAWFPLAVGDSYYNSLNQRVVEVTRTDRSADDDADADLEREMDYGKAVSFFTLGGDPKAPVRPSVAGTISYVDGRRMVIAVAEDADLAPLHDAGVRVGVMLSFDETTYRLMIEALDHVARAAGPLGELRDLIYSPHTRIQARELKFAPLGFSYLNSSQQQGVNKVVRACDVAVVHGPPGTGKTTTLVEAIYETLRRESQVMVCAQSNMSVDWISEKLVDRGVNVVRIGNPSRVNDKMLSFTYERRFESHPDYPTLWSIRKALRALYESRRHGSAEQWHQKVERLKSRAIELELRINNDIFASANVIASTLVGSASRYLAGMKFSTVFIDEAAQALEAACWIPMRRCQRMILAGDHCQLPPTVKSLEAQRGGLGRSLMERIVANHPEAVTLLTVQYRMNRAIMQFSSDAFYNGELRAADEVAERRIVDGDLPIEWVDTSRLPNEPSDADPDDEFQEAVAGESYGRINRAEARLTIRTLKRYIDSIGGRRVLDERIDFGIISPYRAQVRYLRQVLRSQAWAKPFRRLISINTVDGFQGQERDVVMISLVRNNADHRIGFLRELRRMNVAMTRARMKLIIIGDGPTLRRGHPFYRYLYSYVKALAQQE